MNYLNENGLPEKTDTQLSPQLSNAAQEKKIIKKYKFGNNFYYGLPGWFIKDELKDEYLTKIKATIFSAPI